MKEKWKLRRLKNEALRSQDALLTRQIMTWINKLGNKIKRLQKDEQRHCESLNRKTNPKGQGGKPRKYQSEKANLFANRLKRVHQEPDYPGFSCN